MVEFCSSLVCSQKQLSSLEGLTKHKMRDWISMHVGSGRTNDRQSLMSGSATQLPNRIRISNRNNRVHDNELGKNVCIQEEFSTLSTENLGP